MNVERMAESEAARWQDQVYDLLRRSNVTQFTSPTRGIAF